MEYRGEIGCNINCCIKMDITNLLKKIVELNENLKLNMRKINISDYKDVFNNLCFKYYLDYNNLDITIDIKSLTFSNICVERIYICCHDDNLKVEYLEQVHNEIAKIFEIGDINEV